MAAYIEQTGSLAQFRVHKQEPPGQFVLMDNIYNFTQSGDFTYTFQIKGIGTLESGTYSVLVFSPNGQSAQTTIEYIYDRKAALESNPMTVGWDEDGQTLYHHLDVFDMIYGEDPLDTSSQRLEHSFSRQIKYMVIPDGAATITEMTANHLKIENGTIPIAASLDIRLLQVHERGTLVLDIPIDVVEPNPIKLRGFEARHGKAPFDVKSNAGDPDTRLLYYNEVQHIIAIEFTPEHRSFHILGETATPISDLSLIEEYAIPEFDYVLVVMAAGVIAAIAIMRTRRQKSS